MKISLQKLQQSDAASLAKIANNKNVWDTLRDFFPYPYAIEDAIKFIETTLFDIENIHFGIFLNQVLVGTIALNKQKDINRFSMELGYFIGEEYWNKGIASKAVALMIDYAFSKLDINRIFASTIQGNLASTIILEKNGFVLEGVSRKSAYKNKLFKDEYRFGLLKTDYLSNQRDKKQL